LDPKSILNIKWDLNLIKKLIYECRKTFK
jgi:hypothetical protein